MGPCFERAWGDRLNHRDDSLGWKFVVPISKVTPDLLRSKFPLWCGSENIAISFAQRPIGRHRQGRPAEIGAKVGSADFRGVVSPEVSLVESEARWLGDDMVQSCGFLANRSGFEVGLSVICSSGDLNSSSSYHSKMFGLDGHRSERPQ